MNRIRSRKVNKILSRQQVDDETTIEETARKFVAKTREEMRRIGAENTFNSDQSGFNLEMHSGRTLAPIGTKKVVSVVQSVHATTHSYTIQPVVNAKGRLLEPLLLVHPESDGVFGVRVKETMFKVRFFVTIISL